MIYYMTSKVFQDYFLNNESDDSILEAQYVIVSSRIRRKSSYKKNIIISNAILYPSNLVYQETSDEMMRYRYYDQLEDALPFIATLIKGALEEDFQIVFLWTKKEKKLFPYLDYLRDFVYDVFKFPIYEYKEYVLGCPIIEFNEKKVIKKCKKALKEQSKKIYLKNLQTPSGREKIKSDICSMPMKKLIKEVKRIGMYTDELSREDMEEILMLYM